MNTIEALLPLLLAACVAAWLALGVYTLLVRLLHDAVAGIVQSLRPDVGQALQDGADAESLLRRLPRRTLERVAADTATPPEAAAFFAARALERREHELLRQAAPSGRGPRWRRITALRILARARHDAAPSLLEQALLSDDTEIVAGAVATLGELGDLRSSRVLVGALRGNLFARSRVAAQLDGARRS